MRLTIEKYVPLAFLIGLTLLIGISLVSYHSLNDLTRAADQVARTHELIGQLEEGFWCKNSLTIQDIVEKESSKPL
jgi:CHASE3 domain sensor protein